MARLAFDYRAMGLALTALALGCSSDSGEAENAGGNLESDSGAGDSRSPSAEGGELDYGTGGTENLPLLPVEETPPIVFVHGFAGSAQQYESQAQRFVANGYPPERIFAYDHNGGLVQEDFAAGAGAVIDRALEQFGVSQVYLVGHSRGTAVSNTYMGNPDNAAKVAKYVSLDGGGCGVADAAGIPCVAPSQALLPGQAHVEVATSAESFVMQYEFLMGRSPEVVDVVKQKGPVTISGRAVSFPENTGRDGTTLEIWEIDSDTGYRVADAPVATFDIGADGDWGPATVSPETHYELALKTPERGTQHFYPQRFLRDSHFVRLLSGDPDTSATRQNTNSGDGHTAIVAIRMREWYAMDDADNPGDESDILEIGTKSGSGDQAAVNVITSFVGNGAIALHLHDDAATPGETTLGELPYFSGQPFQSGVDVYMPAAEPPDGTITVTNYPRGDRSQPQVLNLPNWASSGHFVNVMFNDFPVD